MALNCEISVRMRQMGHNKKALKATIFMHIQKTAGTSIVHSIRQNYGNQNVMSHGDHLDGWSEFPLVDKFFDPEITQNQFSHVPFISGHFGYDFAKLFLKKRYSFTFLRYPIDRILSLYYFCRSRDPNQFRIYRLTQEYTFDEFLSMGLTEPEIKSCIWNNQTWQLAHGYGNSDKRNISSFAPEEMLELAIRHLDEFSYIGFAETFEKDRDHILKALGITPPLEKIVSNANPERPTAKDLPPSTLKLLDELTHLDQVLYKEAWSQKEVKNGF